MTDQTRVARAFAGIARCVLEESSAAEVAQTFANGCAAAVGLPSVGVRVAPDGAAPSIVAASDERAHLLETLAADGPTPAAYVIRCGRPLVNARLLPDDGRWPLVAATALTVGVGLMTVLPLRAAEAILGTVGFYCDDWVGLDESQLEVAGALAVTATAVLVSARRRDATAARARRLSAAMDQRIRVEQAIGRLAERWNVTPDEAYERIRGDAESRGVPVYALLREAAGADR